MKLRSKIILILGILALTAFGIQYAAATKTTFSDGNPALGQKGTKVTAAFLNAVNQHFMTGLANDGDGSLAYSTVTGTNDLVSTITPTAYFPAQYVTGMPLYFKAAVTNTGAMTLNVNGLGVKSIVKGVSQALAAGDIVSGQIFKVVYDGANFQLFKPYAGGVASGLATLDANSRVAQAANTVWDGTAGRSASPTPAPNTIPVMDSNGTFSSFFVKGFTGFTSSTLPSSTGWYGVAYGNGIFVATSGSGTGSAYSYNGGQTWTAGGALPSTHYWEGACFGNGTFVATSGSASTAAAYSTNGGQTWTASTLPSSGSWYGCAYGNGVFVAGDSASTATAYSTNGQTWTAGGALPTGTDTGAIAYGNGTFVIVSADGNGTTKAAYSTNGGQSWTAATLPSPGGTGAWHGVTYGNGVFVAVSGTGTAAAYSTNGQTWSSCGALPASSNWFSISYGNQIFVATTSTGGNGAGAFSFDNCQTWKTTTLSSTQVWNGMAFGDAHFVTVGGTASTIGAYATTSLTLP